MPDTITLPGTLVVGLGLAAGATIVVLTLQGYRRSGNPTMAWLSAGFVFLTAGLFMEHIWIDYLHRSHEETGFLHLPGVAGFLFVLVSAWMSRGGAPAKRGPG